MGKVLKCLKEYTTEEKSTKFLTILLPLVAELRRSHAAVVEQSMEKSIFRFHMYSGHSG
jgi:hypothetical protein